MWAFTPIIRLLVVCYFFFRCLAWPALSFTGRRIPKLVRVHIIARHVTDSNPLTDFSTADNGDNDSCAMSTELTCFQPQEIRGQAHPLESVHKCENFTTYHSVSHTTWLRVELFFCPESWAPFSSRLVSMSAPISWLSDESFTFNGHEIQKSSFERNFIHGMIADAQRILQDKLLFATSLPEGPLVRIADDMCNTTTLYSFITEPRNAANFSCGFSTLRPRRLAAEDLRRKTFQSISAVSTAS